jgi:glycerol-3-phosphate acyltransferase PlsY
VTTEIIVRFLGAILVGYLLGSLPFGFWIGRRVAGVDIRNFGSGKMGSTNVLRVAGKKAAALVFILDLLKGALAVVLAWVILRGKYEAPIASALWYMVRSAPALAGLAAIAGHVWPVFLKFRGGRGVATFYGGLVALCPPVVLISGPLAILSAGVTRFVSLASIAGAIAAYVILVPLTVVNGFPWENLLYGLIGSVTIIATHRDNIVRLFNGKERKLGEKAETAKLVPRTAAEEQEMRRVAVSRELAGLRWSRQNLHQ